MALVKWDRISLKRGDRELFHDFTLEVPEQSGPFGILGPSGSGKTSLLWAAAGLIPLQSGHITVAGRDIQTLTPRKRAQTLGLVFQDFQLFPHLSVAENIELAPQIHGLDQRKPKDRASIWLEKLGLAGFESRRPHELSGGQKQRVAIARALILEPRVLFLDEPSASLDEKATLDLAKLLADLQKQTQIIVVSHDRVFVDALCTHQFWLSEGQKT
jgi:molybdate transport system ATP-binding protein